MKYCGKCGNWKDESAFRVYKVLDSGKIYYRHPCRDCENAIKRLRRQIIKVLKYKVWYEENQEYIDLGLKQCTVCNKWKPTDEFYARYSQCKDCHKEKTRKRYYSRSEEAKKAYRKIYRTWAANNIGKVQGYSKCYYEKKRGSPSYKIGKNMSRGIHHSLVDGEGKNGRHWEDIVGFTIDKLKAYLESNFEVGMSWSNYGKAGWHIDHIIPRNSYEFTSTDDVEFKKCWSLVNLRPCWALENTSIKKDKMDWDLIKNIPNYEDILPDKFNK